MVFALLLCACINFSCVEDIKKEATEIKKEIKQEPSKVKKEIKKESIDPDAFLNDHMDIHASMFNHLCLYLKFIFRYALLSLCLLISNLNRNPISYPS